VVERAGTLSALLRARDIRAAGMASQLARVAGQMQYLFASTTNIIMFWDIILCQECGYIGITCYIVIYG
jgi:ABC-type ATPase with predicted acetyltransferase domain